MSRWSLLLLVDFILVDRKLGISSLEMHTAELGYSLDLGYVPHALGLEIRLPACYGIDCHGYYSSCRRRRRRRRRGY